MADLIELAERVERASGPDRELDAVIAFATGQFDYRLEYGFENCEIVRGDKRVDDYLHVIVRTKGRSSGGLQYNEAYPFFTSSLDAVVALLERVLPGADWCKLFAPHGPIRVYVRATDFSESVAAAPTASRALLAATLRALSEKGRE